MNTITTLAHLLRINHKLPTENLRFTYLKEVWGLEQKVIAEMEGCSQQLVSKVLVRARKQITEVELFNLSQLEFTPDEIKYIQMLPREILKDVECIAFINNILGIDVVHPFFMHFDYNDNLRIAALASLGVQNKRLMTLFNKSQPSVSMNVKRFMERATTLERNVRYDNYPNYVLSPIRRKNPLYSQLFIKAGGQM